MSSKKHHLDSHDQSWKPPPILRLDNFDSQFIPMIWPTVTHSYSSTEVQTATPTFELIVLQASEVTLAHQIGSKETLKHDDTCLLLLLFISFEFIWIHLNNGHYTLQLYVYI